MKGTLTRFSLTAITAGAMLIVALAGAFSQGASVKGTQIYASTFVCDSTYHRFLYTAPAALTIVEAQIWFGLDKGSWSDFTGELWRLSDGSYMMNGSHDDYTDGGGGYRIQRQSWGGNVYTIAAGDQIVFDTSCSPGATPGHHGAFSVTIWTK